MRSTLSNPRQAPAEKPAERGGPLITISPTDVFTLDGARAALRLSKTCFRREYREGRLRVASRAGRRWILGAWILQWLEGGELPAKAAPKAAKAAGPLG